MTQTRFADPAPLFAPAPFFADVAEGPTGGHAVWVKATDGTRLRLGYWPKGDAKGTVLMLPGRTEYVEKYGRTAVDFHQRGYAMVAIDWRGQGLADRQLEEPFKGHVDDFAEYQQDFDAMIAFARAQKLPEPYFMLAHSMGGCIGLRALANGAPVQAASFTAPMWGILMAAWMRPMALAISTAARWFHLDDRLTPGTSEKTYVLAQGFAGNSLTTDADMWGYMQRQATAHPELTLGGPSLGWLNAALRECHALSLLQSPGVPTQTALGGAEKIVDVGPIHARMSVWQNGSLDLYPSAEHEILMETAATRATFADKAAALFDSNR